MDVKEMKSKHLFIGICLAIVMSSCSDEVVKQTPADLKKYPELKRFFDTCGTFNGGTLDVSSGPFVAQFTASTSASDMFAKLDSIAASDEWRQSHTSDLVHVYTKNLKRYPAQAKDDVIVISFDKEKNVVELNWR